MSKPKPKTYKTREEWLVDLIEKLRPMFSEAGLEIPAVRISCSWPSRSIRKRLGECWFGKAAADGSRQMFITPLRDESAEVAEIVVHELIHGCLPDGTGHKKPFKDAMKRIGLEGRAIATTAGPELRERLNTLCLALGDYPHAALSLADAPGKKQGTRMLKLECPQCGYVVRTTAKWLDAGLPVCVCGETFVAEEK